MVQISQVNNNTPPMQFNVVLLESYDTIHNVQIGYLTNEEFSFSLAKNLAFIMMRCLLFVMTIIICTI